MITTNKYLINLERLTESILIVSIFDKKTKILTEKMPMNSLYDILNALFYLIEYNGSFDIQLPANNTQYGYTFYGGRSASHPGLFQLLLVRQDFGNGNDYKIADEFLEYYEIKNILNDISIFDNESIIITKI